MAQLKAPAWYPLIRAGWFALVGFGLCIGSIVLAIYATLPGSQSVPSMAIFAGLLSVGLALIVVGAVLALRWHHSRRRGREDPPAA